VVAVGDRREQVSTPLVAVHRFEVVVRLAAERVEVHVGRDRVGVVVDGVGDRLPDRFGEHREGCVWTGLRYHAAASPPSPYESDAAPAPTPLPVPAPVTFHSTV